MRPQQPPRWGINNRGNTNQQLPPIQQGRQPDEQAAKNANSYDLNNQQSSAQQIVGSAPQDQPLTYFHNENQKSSQQQLLLQGEMDLQQQNAGIPPSSPFETTPPNQVSNQQRQSLPVQDASNQYKMIPQRNNDSLRPQYTNNQQNLPPQPPPLPSNGLGQWANVENKPKIGTMGKMSLLAQEQYNKLLENETIQAIQGKLEAVKGGIKQDFKNMDRHFQEALRQQKDKMNTWVRLKVEEMIIKILEQLRPTLRENMKDPYMCECVKNIIDDVFDELWPQIEEEVLFQLRIKISEPYSEQVNVKPKLCWLEYPWYWIKSWYLYTVDPFDRSIWQQFRTFSWWFIFIVRLIPFYGIQSYFYIFVFLCIDKKDEFQLVNFILAFKRMQFLSIGVIGTFVGYLTFYSCATVGIYKDHDCQTQGPAIFLDIYADIIGFLCQLILLWLSWILLPCSNIKGKPKFKYAKPKEQKEVVQGCLCCYCNDRGGKLKMFLIYDLIICICCVVVYVFLIVEEGQHKEIWQYKAALYLVKTIYGIFSFPFMVFVLPSVTYLLTKSRDTGYDIYGNCVPQVPNLKKYHKDKLMKSSILNKGKPKQGDFDNRYSDQPDGEIDLIEQEPLMDELVIV